MPKRYTYTVARRDGQETEVTQFYEDRVWNLYLFLHLADRYAQGLAPVGGTPPASRPAGGHHRRAEI
jgi:hypothetical protein